MAWHATFQHFHSAHATGPQQSLQITTTWSMQLKVTHATKNKCNNQTNNAVEVARQCINECRLKIPLQMFIMTLRCIALCASHNMEQPTSAGRHLILCLPDQGARGVTQTKLQWWANCESALCDILMSRHFDVETF